MTRDLTGITRSILGLILGACIALPVGHTITTAQGLVAAVRVQEAMR